LIKIVTDVRFTLPHRPYDAFECHFLADWDNGFIYPPKEFTLMWKILGEETLLPEAGDVWRRRLAELSLRKKDRERFLKLLKVADIRVVLDGVREVWMFIINLPEGSSREDLEFVRDFLIKINKGAGAPLMELDGEAQKVSIAVSSEEYSDDYSLRRTLRTEMKAEEDGKKR
jgi:hypothetical protein